MSALPRVWWVSDGRGDAVRIARIVREALVGGARGFVLREPGLGAAEYLELCRGLLAEVGRAGGLLLAHEREAPLAAGAAHGLHRKAAALREREPGAGVPEGLLLGISAHSRDELAAAARAGADYALLGSVFATPSHAGIAGHGVEGVRELVRAARLPVVGIGGIDAAGARALAGSGLAGVACMRAIAEARDVARAARELVAAFGGGGGA